MWVTIFFFVVVLIMFFSTLLGILIKIDGGAVREGARQGNPVQSESICVSPHHPECQSG